MAQQNHIGDTLSPALANSYGLEVRASEHLQHPAPQLRYDGGASAPQVIDQHSHAQQNEKPVEYAPYQAPETVSATDGTGSPRKKTILGLSTTLFWVIAGLIVLVVLGVALGAGLGVGLSNHNGPNQAPQTSSTSDPTTQSETTSPMPTTSPPSATTSSTSTSTSSAPVTKGTVGLAANSCNFTTPKTFYLGNTGFTEYCFTDWPNKDESFDGKGNVTDLTRTTVYTFEACMQACLDYNGGLDTGETRCTAVTYNANLTSIIAIGRQGGNCFLKDKRGINQQGSAESACAALAN
ncbi:hypothetical protein CONLIGDRAFT_626306 [Coniochaeta ligniaria NRRL 30616]|uniref:Apple domain-containing protein n=1 Tax=Coniochaeta ligniaria NRRL 30616 TaxID=1408157 RepID=A0A1J7J386_9PEZI|nr:hypothetical protein CONLIGDRAFT_626306 [Coniochaeta ligniaria NRRL 30616]